MSFETVSKQANEQIWKVFCILGDDKGGWSLWSSTSRLAVAGQWYGPTFSLAKAAHLWVLSSTLFGASFFFSPSSCLWSLRYSLPQRLLPQPTTSSSHFRGLMWVAVYWPRSWVRFKYESFSCFPSWPPGECICNVHLCVQASVQAAPTASTSCLGLRTTQGVASLLPIEPFLLFSRVGREEVF